MTLAAHDRRDALVVEAVVGRDGAVAHGRAAVHDAIADVVVVQLDALDQQAARNLRPEANDAARPDDRRPHQRSLAHEHARVQQRRRYDVRAGQQPHVGPDERRPARAARTLAGRLDAALPEVEQHVDDVERVPAGT